MSISLSALAQHVGVSLSTASRALNGYTDVNPQTRARVLEAAKQLGYRPNAIARTLATGKTSLIALVTSVDKGQNLDATFPSLFAGVRDAVRDAGYSVVAAEFPFRDNTQESFEKFAASGFVDGIILTRTQPQDRRVTILQSLGVPFVSYGRTEANDHTWVDVDNERVFSAATQRLIGFGHTRIALLNALRDYSFAQLREHGVRRTMAEAGINVEQSLIVRHGETTAEAGHAHTQHLLDGGAVPTAILCATDALAFGTMAALRERGLTVGVDVSVIGCGNSEAARYCAPGLTSIEQHTRDNGAQLGQFLLQRLQNVSKGHLTHLVSTTIVARQSDGPANRSKFY